MSFSSTDWESTALTSYQQSTCSVETPLRNYFTDCFLLPRTFCGSLDATAILFFHPRTSVVQRLNNKAEAGAKRQQPALWQWPKPRWFPTLYFCGPVACLCYPQPMPQQHTDLSSGLLPTPIVSPLSHTSLCNPHFSTADTHGRGSLWDWQTFQKDRRPE